MPRKYFTTVLLLVILCTCAFTQVTTPNLQLQLPPRGTPNYDVILNSNFSNIDTAIGILQTAYQGTWNTAVTYSKGQQVTYLGNLYVSLINSNSSNTPVSSPVSWGLVFSASGTVTSVSDLSPLFTVTNRTTVPTFVLSTQAQNAIFAGPAAGGSGAPLFRSMVALDLPSTIFAATTGNAATATQLQSTPTLCTAGNAPRGVDTFGNATGCASLSGGGLTLPATKTVTTNQWLDSYDSGTGVFHASQIGFSNLSGSWVKAQAPSSNVYTDQLNNYGAGFKQTFASSATTAGIGHGGVSADPSSLVDGDEWYNTTSFRMRARANGVSQSFAWLTDIPATFAPSAITGFGTAGNYMRSTGSAWAASTIQVADVPTLNQNTTGKATGNMMNWSTGPYAGSIPATTPNVLARTTFPSAVTVVSFTMYLVTPSVACTTLPQYQLYDITSSTALSTITTVNGTAYYSNTGLSIAVTGGHDIGIRVGVSAAGCTTAPANGMWTAWYTM
jgi:hypothetical protein